MDNFGLNENGFKRKTYTDILDDMFIKARELFGDNINLTSRSALGLLLRVIAWALSIIWQVAETVYLSAFINDAEGVSLDRRAANIGVVRLGERYSSGYVTLKGEPYTEVPAGFIVANKRGITYITVDDYNFEDNTEIKVYVESSKPGGDTNSIKEEVTDIITPILGVESAINEQAITGGRDVETDDEFRLRYFASIGKVGASTINAITAYVLQVEGVRGALTEENTTDEVDEQGRPPHSIQVYVHEGDKQEIGQAVFDTKAAGIETVGNTNVTVKDISGKEREVKFSYAEEVKIKVKIIANIDEDYDKESMLLENKVKEFIGGVDTKGVEHSGLTIGEDVIVSQIVRELWDVDGLIDVDVEVAKIDEEYSKDNINIDFTEVAFCEEVMVEYV